MTNPPDEPHPDGRQALARRSRRGPFADSGARAVHHPTP